MHMCLLIAFVLPHGRLRCGTSSMVVYSLIEIDRYILHVARVISFLRYIYFISIEIGGTSLQITQRMLF